MNMLSFSRRVFNKLMVATLILSMCSFSICSFNIVQAEETGQTIYVSLSGNDNWSGGLAEPDGDGTDGPFRTISRANVIASPGDTIIIRAGNYNEPICPVNSGVIGNPIVYKSYDEEAVTICEGQPISGLTSEEYNLLEDDPYGLYIYGKSYITIEGIQIDYTSMGDTYPGRWGRIVNSSHITLKNVIFRHTMVPGTSGGVAFINSHYNTITGCTFDEGNDNLLLVQSDYNLVHGNTFTKGRHTLWCIRAGSYNILRNNYFHNELQKIP